MVTTFVLLLFALLLLFPRGEVKEWEVATIGRGSRCLYGSGVIYIFWVRVESIEGRYVMITSYGSFM